MAGFARRKLRGRRAECEALDRLLAGARAGESRVLVLRGEAGIGKSALIEYLVESAAGTQIVRAAGVESEMELAYAGLHQLCTPLMAHVDGLPGPQRDALAVAFGLASGSTPDRFLVGLAMVSLLAEAAEEQPLICVVDDAQWLDRVSSQTLAFVARRLLAERVAIVFAARGPTSDSEPNPLVGLPELMVPGLRAGDARALLDSAVPGRLDERVRDRIIAETGGNPLALLELPRGLTAAELAGGFGRPDAQPLANQIEHSFLRRIESLPASARRLLLAAAAEPVGDVALLRRVADLLAVRADAEAIDATGLIEVGARVRFRHPLARSAAYRSASVGDRRDVHRALAEATDPDVDPDRRAWHRAFAASEPDEAVAGELERSADRAQDRGGLAAAAAFLRRAAELTPDPAQRGARAAAAARASLDAGALDAALELLGAAELAPSDALRSARLARLRAQIVFARRRNSEALPVLLDAAARLAALDDGEAREAYLEAFAAAIFAGRLDGRGGVQDVAAAARAAPSASEPPRLTDELLGALVTRFAEGYVAAVPPLGRALRAARRDAVGHPDDNMRWLWLSWLVAGELWDDDSWHDVSTLAVRRAREAGALRALPLALTYRAAVHIFAGELATASELIEESDRLTEATGGAPLRYGSLVLLAWRGNDPQASTTLEADVQEATARGEGRAIGLSEMVRSVLYNGHGRYEAALASAERACEYEDLIVAGFSLVELVEAGARGRAPDAAATALRRLQERTEASGTDWGLGILARSRALLSDGAAAERLYREAIERLERSRIAVHLARAHLVYGEWLRRENRRLDARKQLRVAHEMLQSFGTGAFAERARRELVALGEAVRTRTPGGSVVLTSQETQVARLAGDGKTNLEIGAELFISPRTVEWHLHKVFVKLDVTSRSKLRQALATV